MSKNERASIYMSLAIALSAVARLTTDGNDWILWALSVLNFMAAIAVAFFSKEK